MRLPHSPRLLERCALLVVPVLLALIASPARAEVKLPSVFGDRMILQREKPARIGGWAEPGEPVTAKFAGQRAAGGQG